MPKIIAVDFDGTLCENKWPEIGRPNWEMIDYVRKQQNEGAKIILWTCRTGQMLASAVNWCFGCGIEFDAVNKNVPEIIELYGEDGRKVTADEYIDDKNNTKFKLPYIYLMEDDSTKYLSGLMEED